MAKNNLTSNTTGSISVCSNQNISITSNGNGGPFVSNGTISTLKTRYHILGEDVEVSGFYQDGATTIMIATLNVLGKPFLDELHKNNTFFPTEIEEYLEKKFKWLERDKKIDDIIN
jgi:hypothetical protein